MLNLDLIGARLSQYGMVWLAAFVLAVASTLIPIWAFDARLAEAADMTLMIAFPSLGVLLVAALVVFAVARETWLTRGTLIVLTLILALPLFWSPVLAVVAAAWANGSAIEYSEVYAGFRILVGKASYAITEEIFGSPLVDAAWSAMQIFAGLLGFISAFANTVRVIRRLSQTPAEPAPG